jgi:hypothetical protein
MLQHEPRITVARAFSGALPDQAMALLSAGSA